MLPRRVATTLMVAVVFAAALVVAGLGPLTSRPAGAAVEGLAFTETGCEEYSDSVARLYQAGLGRAPEEAGFRFWLDAYAQGEWSFPRMAAFFVASPEFQRSYGELDDLGFVQQLYRNVLGREGEAAGVTFWLGELESGSSRALVLMRFAESPENVARTGTTAPAFGPFNNGWSMPWSCNEGGGITARVVSVTDGDTLTVSINGVNERVRLIGVNAPEAGECFAAQATAELRSLTFGRSVILRVDRSDRDAFGRLLRHVFVDDPGRGEVFVNSTLVEGGFAIANRYEPDTSRADELDAAQARAEANQRGLWASGACGAPAPVDLVITNVNADAPGDDNVNKNGEWVTIRSQSGAADLTGFVLKDESATHRYRFPDGFVLPQGASVRVFTGCGSDSETNLYWCNTRSAVWNNSGDTAFLLDPNGNIVDQFSYSG